MFKKEDCIVGIVSVLIGIGIIVRAQRLVVKFVLDPAGPKALPVIIAVGIIIIGVILIVGGWLASRTIEKEPSHRTAAQWVNDYRPVLFIIVFSLIYAGFMDILGYLLLTPLLIAGIMWALDERGLKRIAKVSLTMTLILYVIFRWGLQVKFPQGIFENFF
jgi:putative tricarboxylic transport membrane protein